MASAKGEISLNETGRRTRSGRKAAVAATPVPATAVRTTRRGSKRNTEKEHDEEEPREAKPFELSENVSEEVQNNVFMDVDNFLYEGTEIKESIAETDQDEHGQIVEEIRQEQIIEETPQDECILYEEVVKDVQRLASDDAELYVQDADVPHNVECTIDEKSSSFPFATVEPSDTSEDPVEDVCEATAENSLLASLAGDNANSLPSVGGGEEHDSNRSNFDRKEEAANELEDSFSDCDKAIAEEADGDFADVSNATLVNTEEIVSDDELPLPSKPEINDAEEVSDEELPAPQRAELPADAEVISEDELPASSTADKHSPAVSPSHKKHKMSKQKRRASEMDKKADGKNKNCEEYNPMSPTSESNDVPPVEKKIKTEELETPESKLKSEKDKDKEREREREKETKKLPDLDKYWRVVKQDAADFTGWTYLLQYVDNESDAEAAREAYDAFLSHYPYCYGYWRKYADYEKRKGIKANCNAVFERGLEAIPLSVDLWIHYLSHVKSIAADNEEYVRQQFKRAVDACGLEFRSDKLWDAFIKWETDGKRYNRVLQIYDRLLVIPTYSYSSHFTSFQDFINQHPIAQVLSSDELKKLRTELRDPHARSSSRSKSRHNSGTEHDSDHQKEDKKLEICQEADAKKDADDHESTEEQPKVNLTDDGTLTKEEESAIREKVLSLRRKLHKQTVAAVTARWSFEEGIKRPYFHVKPLERCQLKNWLDYLDFEIEKGDRKRILVLFERCLIACALYDEFWLKMIRYLETQLDDPDMIALTSDVFRRACTIHHPDKPSLHLLWAAFEECQNNFDGAAEILTNFEKKCANYLQLAYRRINLERRRGDLTKCKQLYEHYITSAENKTIAGSLSIKYARFLNKICNNLDDGLQVLRQALEKDSANARIALQMIDLALQREKVDEDEVVQIMDKFMGRDSIDPEQKILFAQRKVEFLEDFGTTAKGLQEAQRALQIALNKANEAKKKRDSSPNRKSATSSKDNINPTTGSNNQPTYNNGSSASSNANYYNTANSAYYGQQNSGAYQQPYDNYYNQWQYGTNYSGYNQWGSYSNYYNN